VVVGPATQGQAEQTEQTTNFIQKLDRHYAGAI